MVMIGLGHRIAAIKGPLTLTLVADSEGHEASAFGARNRAQDVEEMMLTSSQVRLLKMSRHVHICTWGTAA